MNTTTTSTSSQSTIIRKGYYTKHYNINEPEILSFDATTDKEDTHHTASRALNKNGFQVCEDRKELSKFFEMTHTNTPKIEKYFNTLYYSFYNIYGQRVKNLLVYFDFENNTISVENGKKYKIEECREFTHKILKTKIKAIDGIRGFYNFIVGSMHVDSPFNSHSYNILEHLKNN